MPDIHPVFRIEHHATPKLALDAKPAPTFMVVGTGGDGLSPRERKIAMDAVRRDAAASRKESEARAKPIQAAYRAAAATPAFEKRYPNATVRNLGGSTVGENIGYDGKSGMSKIPSWAADDGSLIPERNAIEAENNEEELRDESRRQRGERQQIVADELSTKQKPRAGLANHANDAAPAKGFASRWPNANTRTVW